MSGETYLDAFQVIDAFYDCSLTEKDLAELKTLPSRELYTQAKEAARSLGLTGDGIGNYYIKEGLKWRVL